MKQVNDSQLVERTLVEHLQNIKNLLLKYGWCQYAFARDNAGEKVNIFSSDVTEFCIRGLIYRYADNDELYKRILLHICGSLDEDLKAKVLALNNLDLEDRRFVNLATAFLTDWNDAPKRTKEDVLSLLDKSINLVKDYYFRK